MNEAMNVRHLTIGLALPNCEGSRGGGNTLLQVKPFGSSPAFYSGYSFDLGRHDWVQSNTSGSIKHNTNS